MAAKLCFCLSVVLCLFLSESNRVSGAPVDTAVQEAIDYAMKKFNANKKNEYIWKIIEVVSAESQVAEKTKTLYILKIDIEQTLCKKGDLRKPDKCPVNANMEMQMRCQFKVTKEKWIDEDFYSSYAYSCRSL
ncbi:cystatin-like [Discoglossus pictus]